MIYGDTLSQQRQRRQTVDLLLLAIVGACALFLMLGILMAGPGLASVRMAMGLVLAVLACAAIWRRPVVAVYILFGAAVLIEEYPIGFGTSFTDRVPLFHSFPGTIPLNPVFMLGLLALAVMLLRLREASRPVFEKGPVFYPLVALMLAMLYGSAKGLLAGADPRLALLSTGGLVLMAIAYVLTANLIRTKSQARVLFLIFVAAVAIKAANGLFRFVVDLHMHLGAIDRTGDANSLLAHEESFFFILALFLCALVYVFRARKQDRNLMLMTALLIAIPLVANQRRTAVVAVALLLALLFIVLYALQLSKRRTLIMLAVMAIVMTPAYLFVTWNSSSLIATPTQAVKSGIQPDQRDASSNAYRDAENLNALHTFHDHPLGQGIGVPMEEVVSMRYFGAEAPTDWLTPHNGLMWLLMTMGLLGFAAFVYFFASAGMHTVAALRSVQDADLRIAYVLGLLGLATYLVWVVLDRGIIDQRLGIFVGVQIGLLALAPKFAGASEDTSTGMEFARGRA